MKKLFLLFVLMFGLVSCSVSDEETVISSGFLSPESELFHDFGAINIEGGFIDHSFSFTNSGDEELTIMNLSTSCGCTMAEVILEDGSSSGKFGMRDAREWNQSIAPGEDFDVLVTYDPMAHGPNATGEMNRSVIMVTSSEENGRAAVIDPQTGYSFTQINIHGDVMSAEDFMGN